MISAWNLSLGCIPSGIAGTGKTESVKDLSHHLGKQIIVFNCQEILDVSMIVRLFSG